MLCLQSKFIGNQSSIRMWVWHGT